MRTGVVLPTFRETPDEAFAAAAQAVAAGVDGVFCYDHIWPLGQPHRPALAPFPVLGALGDAASPAPAGGGPVPRHARGPGRPRAQRRVGRAVHGARAARPGAGDRRARHRRPAERGREPCLRDPLSVCGRAPGGAGAAGPRAGQGGTRGLGRRGHGRAHRRGPVRRRGTDRVGCRSGVGGAAGRGTRSDRGHVGRPPAHRGIEPAGDDRRTGGRRCQLGRVRMADRRRAAGGRRAHAGPGSVAASAGS